MYKSKSITKTETTLFILYAFVLFSGFSNAPGYLHNAITIPSILSFLIILVYLPYKVDSKYLTIIVYLCFLGLALSYLLSPFPKVFRTYSHSVSYIWMILLFVSMYIAGRSHDLNLEMMRRLLLIGLGLTVFYGLIESYAHFIDIDLGSYIPRVARQGYEIASGFGFYRTRAFNYESAYLAMYLNVGFALLLAISSRHKSWIVFIWFIALIHTMSLTQVALFVFLMCIVLFIKMKDLVFFFIRVKGGISLKFNFKKVSWNYLLFSALLITFIILIATNFSYWDSWILALKKWYIQNLTGLTPSSTTRFGLYQMGYSLVLDSWPLGIGVGNIQGLGVNGLASFYLSLVVQLGVLSIPFFLLYVFFFYRSLLTRNIWIIGSFMFASAHLLIIDTFYLPQVFLPVLFAEMYIRNRVQF